MAVHTDDPPPEPGNPNEGSDPHLAWYESDPRGVFRLDPPGFHIPRRLEKTLRAHRFQITSDEAFTRVIQACGDPRREGGWIVPQIVSLFELFHESGFAHSIEAWIPREGPPTDPVLDDPEASRRLVGGLYGLCVGSVFCAESMFSRPDLGGRDASKACLATALRHCCDCGFTMMDTQMWSEHLGQFGCERISREAYLDHLFEARDRDVVWHPRR